MDAETIVVRSEGVEDDLNQRGPVGRKSRFGSHADGRVQLGQQPIPAGRPEDDYVLKDPMNGSGFRPAGCWMKRVQGTGCSTRCAEVTCR